MCLVTRATALKLAVAFLKICRNCGTFSRFAVSLALGQKPNLRQARRGTGDPMRPCRPPGRIAANSRGVAQLFQREPVSSPRRHTKEKGCAVQSTSRDLASREIWERSLERSIRRRELLASGRKQESRRRR